MHSMIVQFLSPAAPTIFPFGTRNHRTENSSRHLQLPAAGHTLWWPCVGVLFFFADTIIRVTVDVATVNVKSAVTESVRIRGRIVHRMIVYIERSVAVGSGW